MMVNKYTLKNKHTCMFMLEGGGRWSCWKTPTTLKDEHECLSLRVVEGGSDGRQPPLLKTSVSRSFSMVVLCWGVSSPFVLAAAAAAAVIVVRIGSCSCSCGCHHRPHWQPQLQQLLLLAVLLGVACSRRNLPWLPHYCQQKKF